MFQVTLRIRNLDKDNPLSATMQFQNIEGANLVKTLSLANSVLRSWYRKYATQERDEE